MGTRTAATLVVGGSIAALALLTGWGTQPAPRANGQPQGARAGAPDMGTRLVAGLRATEGCLQADAVQWSDGRNSIFAWFENKAAVERWYDSETHQRMMGPLRAAVPGAAQNRPLAHVTDDDLPVMVVATIDFNGPPAVPGPIPFSSIAIELYTPLPGGAFVNKRLAPEGFAVEHMRDFSPGATPPTGG